MAGDSPRTCPEGTPPDVSRRDTGRVPSVRLGRCCGAAPGQVLQRVAVPDAHGRVPAPQAETLVERNDVLVTAQIDHVQVPQLREEPANELGADAAVLVL